MKSRFIARLVVVLVGGALLWTAGCGKKDGADEGEPVQVNLEFKYEDGSPVADQEITADGPLPTNLRTDPDGKVEAERSGGLVAGDYTFVINDMNGMARFQGSAEVKSDSESISVTMKKAGM